MTSNQSDVTQTKPDATHEASHLVLTHPSGGHAKIYRYGAHLTSWTDNTGREHFFLSPRTRYGDGFAIRGGIPVVFPQFANTGSLPKHGLVRTRIWDVLHQEPSTVILRITDDDTTRTLWPYSFLAELHVTLGNNMLTVALHITNTGNSPFSFTSALHNYFNVDDISVASVKGLTGNAYCDKVRGDAELIDTAPAIHVEGETDRVYTDGPREVHIDNITGARSLHITAAGFGDWVIWNPGSQLATTLVDMEPAGYQRMLCVEAALVHKPLRLDPGNHWCGTQILRA